MKRFFVTVTVAFGAMLCLAYAGNPIDGEMVNAAARGDWNKVRSLVREGADVNARNGWGESALMIASWHGRREVVRWLLENSADINATNANHWNALMMAAARGNREVVEQLLARGAQVNGRTRFGWTPLMLAAAGCYSDLVEILIRHGASPQITDFQGNTILAWDGGCSRKTQMLIRQRLAGKHAHIPPVDESGEKEKAAAPVDRDRLMAWLQSPDHTKRMEAAKRMGSIKQPWVLQPLLKALKDKRWVVREEAAGALGSLGDPTAVKPLVEKLHDNEPWVRRRAAVALGKIGDSRAAGPLIEAMKDSDTKVRLRVAEALGKLKPPLGRPSACRRANRQELGGQAEGRRGSWQDRRFPSVAPPAFCHD